jgi:DHA1 family bicyclomycin/chloramphenicol resistance-like MFS transporter
MAGTASSLLGTARFAFGAISAPLVGLGGADTALPLGLVTGLCVLFAAVAHQVLLKHARTAIKRFPQSTAS